MTTPQNDPHSWYWRDTPLRHVPRWLLADVLARLSKRDRDLVLHWYDRDSEWQRARESDAVRYHQTYTDLHVVVRDQAAHIASLEAQLLPHLRDTTQGVQESLA